MLWDEVAEVVRKDYPSVEYRKYHVDAIAARMITHPGSLDVIVCSNLFGDILTDIGSAISGSLGIAPGANINPERTYPSMFEPIHATTFLRWRTDKQPADCRYDQLEVVTPYELKKIFRASASAD